MTVSVWRAEARFVARNVRTGGATGSQNGAKMVPKRSQVGAKVGANPMLDCKTGPQVGAKLEQVGAKWEPNWAKWEPSWSQVGAKLDMTPQFQENIRRIFAVKIMHFLF